MNFSSKNAAGNVQRASNANKRIEVENRIHGIGQKIITFENQLAETLTHLESTRAALKGHPKGSYDAGALERQAQRLEGDAVNLRSRIGHFKSKLPGLQGELDESLKAYQIAIDAEIGTHGYSSMVDSLRGNVSEAEAVHAGLAGELDAIEKRYGSKLVKNARDKIDAGLKVVQAVEKVLIKA